MSLTGCVHAQPARCREGHGAGGQAHGGSGARMEILRAEGLYQRAVQKD